MYVSNKCMYLFYLSNTGLTNNRVNVAEYSPSKTINKHKQNINKHRQTRKKQNMLSNNPQMDHKSYEH